MMATLRSDIFSPGRRGEDHQKRAPALRHARSNFPMARKARREACFAAQYSDRGDKRKRGRIIRQRRIFRQI
jgi:hypothetical protein